MTFNYNCAKPSDALRISVLLKTVYIDTYATKGVTLEFANFTTKRFSPEYVKQSILNNPEQFLIATYEGNPVGVLEIIFEKLCPITKSKLPELSKLYVLNNFSGQRVGKNLLRSAEKIVAGKGNNQFWLEVWLKNQKAIDFYKRNGYKIIGQVDFEMEFNTYHNYIMIKNLIHDF